MNNEINQNTQATTVPQPQQQQTLVQMVQQANEKANAPVDFESLSPLEKQQLIDRAIKEAELKCKINKPKAWNGLIFTCVFLIILCIACVIILNTLT